MRLLLLLLILKCCALYSINKMTEIMMRRRHDVMECRLFFVTRNWQSIQLIFIEIMPIICISCLPSSLFFFDQLQTIKVIYIVQWEREREKSWTWVVHNKMSDHYILFSFLIKETIAAFWDSSWRRKKQIEEDEKFISIKCKSVYIFLKFN